MKIWWIRNSFGGLFGANLTVALILYAQWVIVSMVLLPWQGFNYHTVLYTACSLLALISHSRAQYCDPGSVPRFLTMERLPTNIHRVKSQDLHSLRICRECKTLCVPGGHHCSQCQRCIIHFDHHCPWINNCVGLMNQKFFLLFLFYTAVCCIYSGGLLVARFFSCSNFPQQCTVSGSSTVFCIVTFVEALIFGLFVIIMMADQFSALCSMVSGDEHYHEQDEKGGEETGSSEKDKRKRQTFLDILSVSMGGRPNPLWFLPINQGNELWNERERLLLRTRAAAEVDLAELYDRINRAEKAAANSDQEAPSGTSPGPAVPILGSSKSPASVNASTNPQNTASVKETAVSSSSKRMEPLADSDAESDNSDRLDGKQSKFEAVLKLASKMNGKGTQSSESADVVAELRSRRN